MSEVTKLLEVKLQNGLCNKLFCLMSACQIAIQNKFSIVEPIFGWTRPILFGEIYDIKFFNEYLRNFTGGYDLIIEKTNILKNQTIIKNQIDLWQFSEKILKTQRDSGIMDKNCMNIAVLNGLKLNKLYEHLAKEEVDIFIHLRIESDWVNHSKNKIVEADEMMLTNINQFVDMYNSTSFQKSSIFFSSGENQEYIKNCLCEKGLESKFFFNKEFEYELNAAINFEIACRSKIFIGISRSTFSNCITLKRSCIGYEDNDYIYNFQNKIKKRIDNGLQPNPQRATSIVTRFV